MGAEAGGPFETGVPPLLRMTYLLPPLLLMARSLLPLLLMPYLLLPPLPMTQLLLLLLAFRTVGVRCQYIFGW